MSETGNPTPEDRYEHFRGLSLEEIQEHLAGLAERFEGVKEHYEGPVGRLRSKIRDEDMKQLVDAFGDLLPMTLNPAVQAEVMAEGVDDPANLTSSRISGLTQDVMLFAAGFKNSGITVIPLAR